MAQRDLEDAAIDALDQLRLAGHAQGGVLFWRASLGQEPQADQKQVQRSVEAREYGRVGEGLEPPKKGILGAVEAQRFGRRGGLKFDFRAQALMLFRKWRETGHA